MDDIHQIKSFNWNAGISTAIFFILGLLYYLYKFHHFQNIINQGTFRRPNNNNQNNSNNNNNENNQTNNTQNNQDNQNPSNTNQNQNINQENYLIINFLIGGNREKITHNIHKDLPMRTFIQMNLSNHYNPGYQSVHLIYQGIRLDISRPFSYYPQIKNEAIVHCFFTSMHSNSENRGRENNNNYRSNVEYDDNAVQLQSIVFHLCFFMLGMFLIFCYKKFPEIFSTQAKYILGFIYVLWLNQLSKILAKFIIFRRVNWNI